MKVWIPRSHGMQPRQSHAADDSCTLTIEICYDSIAVILEPQKMVAEITQRPCNDVYRVRRYYLNVLDAFSLS